MKNLVDVLFLRGMPPMRKDVQKLYLSCVSVPLGFKPRCDMMLYKSLFSDSREPPVSPGEPRILNKVADLTT
jgi:hypothetical protein